LFALSNYGTLHNKSLPTGVGEWIKKGTNHSPAGITKGIQPLKNIALITSRNAWITTQRRLSLPWFLLNYLLFHDNNHMSVKVVQWSLPQKSWATVGEGF